MKTQKVWYITGTSSGFGFEIAKAALEAGDKVTATVRKGSEQLRESLNNHPDLLVVTMDVTHEAEVKQAIKETVDHFGKIDVLVNNAGYGFLGAIEEATDADVRQQYDTNVFGVLNVIRAALPYMRKQRSGHIINTSSLFAFTARPGWSLYGSTKFAIEGISQGLAAELGSFGIHVTAIEPGLFTTEFSNNKSYKMGEIIDDYENSIVGQVRRGSIAFHGKQPGDPKKLGNVVVELAHSENPPLHLPIGRDSVENYRINAQQLANDIEAWKDISETTDYQLS
ncbi:MAG: NADP-dependent 3-hydroxy acid dehydrogenase YdfG [Mucilaginibacter sp.]|nr:NADP-dependent 3-hydroxy acid dehydrogenase YdfG [Mucilaginibacter sp.]